LFRMTMNEALVASTINAAASIGRGATHGSIECGKVLPLTKVIVGSVSPSMLTLYSSMRQDGSMLSIRCDLSCAHECMNEMFSSVTRQ
jgi:hypothetical protein